MEKENLKKDSLNIFETIALSAAMMGPSASVAITSGIIASFAGYSVPLMFVVSMIIVGFVSISIIKLNAYFPSSGSVYFFAQKTLGDRAGFVTGWIIVLGYFMLGVSCNAVASVYFQSLISLFGIHIHWEIISMLMMIIIGYLTYKDAKTSTVVMLIIEVIAMGLIVILAGLIIVRALKTTGLSIEPFKLGKNNFSSLGTASVYGFLAFAGFEGASVLGEESKNPKKMIPLAILSAVIISGIFYVFVAYAQVLGFGLSAEGMKAFSSSEAPLGELISRYLGSQFSAMLLLCIGISFFSTTLGCINAGARVLFTMGRDGMLSKGLSKVHQKYHTPYIGLNIFILIITFILLSGFSMKAIEVGGYAAMTGTLAILLSYIITTIGAVSFFFKNKVWTHMQLVIPILSAFVLVLIVLANIFPVPAFPKNLCAYGVIVWLVIGILLSRKK